MQQRTCDNAVGLLCSLKARGGEARAGRPDRQPAGTPERRPASQALRNEAFARQEGRTGCVVLQAGGEALRRVRGTQLRAGGWPVRTQGPGCPGRREEGCVVHGNGVSKVNGKPLKGVVQGSDVTGFGFGEKPPCGRGKAEGGKSSPLPKQNPDAPLCGAGVVMGSM